MWLGFLTVTILPQTVSLRNGGAEKAAGLQDHCSDVNVFGESSNLLTLESPVHIVGSSENYTDGLLLNPAVYFYLGPDVSDEKGRMLELSWEHRSLHLSDYSDSIWIVNKGCRKK